MVKVPWQMSAMGLWQLTALQQLTSIGLGKLSCVNLDSLANLLMKDNLPGCAHALINKVPVCGRHLYVFGGGGLGAQPRLKAFVLPHVSSSLIPALVPLLGLTSLSLHALSDEECSAMAQLTGLRQLKVIFPRQVPAVGLRQLAALQQLASLGLRYFDCSQLDTVAKHLMKDDLPDCFYNIANKVCIDVAYATGMVSVGL